MRTAHRQRASGEDRHLPGTRHTHPGGRRPNNNHKERDMLGTIAIILIILWLLGLVSSYTLGGLIHILLVIA
ncbi:MAG: lmo0937 family membrane protein, partial [Thiobacillus sp.]|nr:lmo0937 family membrane protein [Thiobacillus sp.]